MGETGCGKTRLIRYMCDVAAQRVSGSKEPSPNMLILKVVMIYVLISIAVYVWYVTIQTSIDQSSNFLKSLI